VAFAVEQSAYGAKAMGSRLLEMTFGYDTSSVRFEPDGRVRVAVGLHNHGQGHETTIAQIAADQLGVEVGDIDVVYGDTAIVPQRPRDLGQPEHGLLRRGDDPGRAGAARHPGMGAERSGDCPPEATPANPPETTPANRWPSTKWRHS
jgi:CO/xanthine dehydrogenase Mo-binding subunit